jgi:type I site-specific restriction endonuclease
MRMVWSYWDMVANIVNRGLIDEEFFFENTGEQWMVWDRLKPLVPTWREMFKNPHVFENLEIHCSHMEQWRERRAPGSNQAMREVAARMRPRITR